MTVLEWDKIGERLYQTGVDRGVLYLKDGTVVPWNGLTSVEDNTNFDLNSYYLDGIKILDHVTPGDFVGKLSAFTYPDEFDQVLGIVPVVMGLSLHEQPPKSFHLSYRTRIGNDLDDDYGYKIHLLYNLVAVPDSHKFESRKNQNDPGEFSWLLTGTPPTIMGHRPTVHISIDSTSTMADLVQEIEDILYGSSTTAPRFPTIDELQDLFLQWDKLYIIDNGDGTWTAQDPTDQYITMTGPTVFQINGADVTYLDADTYQISDTDAPMP